MCAIALDLSYVIPVICRLVYQNHPEVVSAGTGAVSPPPSSFADPPSSLSRRQNFTPGPFYMGPMLGLAVNLVMIFWTFFECIILAFPTVNPITKDNFNYSWVITLGVMLVSLVWYYASAKNRYIGPLTDTQRAEDAGDFGGPGSDGSDVGGKTTPETEAEAPTFLKHK